MSFEPIGSSLHLVTQKYSLGRQAHASLVCRQVYRFLEEQYPLYVDLWIPQKLESGVLYIQALESSAASELFLRLHEIRESLQKTEIKDIIEIRIVRHSFS